ncbi:hypothetical protein [Actinomadura sp. 3N508]|uniref:hypothetical protein n=1 Tax=Actinomadura sp. 3N508 TaxID=3375153 RepID=UPI0037972298
MVTGLVQVPLAAVTQETAVHADEPPKTVKAAVSEERAVAAARQSGDPVEITSQRGEDRTVRALPNGPARR